MISEHTPHFLNMRVLDQQSLVQINWSDLAYKKQRRVARQIAQLAVRCLYEELALYPKPGLVSFVDQGSHTDMNANIFFRSLFSLRHYFKAMAMAGMQARPFADLKQLGIAAEARMLFATGGVNTHRGAIFALGILVAAAGYYSTVYVDDIHLSEGQKALNVKEKMRLCVLQLWGTDLAQHSVVDPLDINSQAALSHGQCATRTFALSGAREEAALGFPSVFELGLPRLERSLSDGRDWHGAQIECLFSLIEKINDTNLLHRGGKTGADFAQNAAHEFLERGGCTAADWTSRAQEIHVAFVRRRLSPGGAADLLAASNFVLRVTQYLLGHDKQNTNAQCRQLRDIQFSNARQENKSITMNA